MWCCGSAVVMVVVVVTVGGGKIEADLIIRMEVVVVSVVISVVSCHCR